MKLILSSQKKLASSALLAHIERRMHFALDRFTGLVRDVKVRIIDDNGPKGGADKVVRVVARLEGGETLRVEERGSELYATADSIADKLKNTIARACDRLKSKRLRVQRAGF